MAARRKYDQQTRAWLAWHTAWLTAYAPRKSKDFKPFADFIGEPKKLPPVQTPEEMKAVFAAMRRARG